MKAGAYDYLVKDQERDYLRMLPLAVDQAIRAKETEDTSRILSHALMSAADSIFVTDLAGEITFVNSAAGRTYGYAGEDMLGRDISTIGETASDGEYYHARSDSSTFPVSLTRSVVTDDAGRDIAVVVLSRDITERKEAEEVLQRINQELEGYAHTVSHDLKGPLASTVLAASTLKKILGEQGLAEEGSSIASLLQILDNNSWKSSALIDNLLALAEAGQMPDELESVDVGEVVAQIVEENAGAVDSGALVMQVKGPLGTIVGSPTHIYQLFSNLIGNCVKHCDSERPVVTVAHLRDAAGLHTYLVRDNGSGIREDELEKVFVPFYRGVSGGTGIGLATVQKIVDLYGGWVRAYNDGGACFEFAVGDLET
jgi:signal transduction histidine kinase